MLDLLLLLQCRVPVKSSLLKVFAVLFQVVKGTLEKRAFVPFFLEGVLSFLRRYLVIDGLELILLRLLQALSRLTQLQLQLKNSFLALHP